MTSNDFGRATEARFVMEAQLRGYTVARPFAEAAGYDVIVDVGHKLYRVQIKGARPMRVKMPSGRLRQPEHRFTFKPSRQFDIFAGWVDGEGTWIFLPSSQLRRVRQLALMTASPSRRSIGDWDIFTRANTT